ncbi:putative NADH-ubiquinone oxidoreductase 9.5 kDa subunit [Westerdykella ornata]|uniref:Putative NADH-ubiquinone oxidoreductase 9.5 kDa subunit n=1 Tax=Westerdykella ornata TaxID=318751 RepID=A0A6A6JLH6_WESOR|nr:putative NADH-ubiquinone oxidoreductase 9.5 kDa subunit [Westerdykella ornata]KAF2276506.1 putative NADH-ubiquinone oxidoreductase 9.5 kDa subunit [Westerdykella ornata]
MPTAPTKPEFWKTPIHYLRWASINRPAYFWASCIGALGPAMFFIAPPIRRFFGDDNPRPKIPRTYPIPKGPRPRPAGFEDE